MKGKMNVNPNLKVLEQTLSGKYDYVLLGISTTGDKESDDIIRCYAQVYHYDEETKSYETATTFDRLIQADPEKVNAAVEDTSGWNAFAGIHVGNYRSGKDVMSPEKFREDFLVFLKSLDQDTLFIENGAQFCNKYLEKIDCADVLLSKDLTGYLLDTGKLINEYYSKNKIHESQSLEKVFEVLTGKKPSDKLLLGIDNRLNIVQRLVTQHGIDVQILEKDEETHLYKEDKAIRESWSAKGRDKYASGDLTSKIETLKTTGVVDEKKITEVSEDSDLGKMVQAIEFRKGMKGIIALQTATTGFKSGDCPIQFSAMALKYDGKGGFQRPHNDCWIRFDIQGNEQDVAKALMDEKFDAFKYTGIDKDVYRRGLQTKITKDDKPPEPLISLEEAASRIEKFLRAHRDYTIISAGRGGTKKNLPYALECFDRSGHGISLGPNHNDFVDFSQFIKEYTAKCEISGVPNKLYDPQKLNGGMTLPNLAAARNMPFPTSTMEKVQLMLIFSQDYMKQHYEEAKDSYKDTDRRMREEAKIDEAKDLQQKRESSRIAGQGAQRPASASQTRPTAAQRPTPLRDFSPDINDDEIDGMDDLLATVYRSESVTGQKQSGWASGASKRTPSSSGRDASFIPPGFKASSSGSSRVSPASSDTPRPEPVRRPPASADRSVRRTATSDPVSSRDRVIRRPDRDSGLDSSVYRLLERQQEMMQQTLSSILENNASMTQVFKELASSLQQVSDTNKSLSNQLTSSKEEKTIAVQDLDSPENLDLAMSGAKELLQSIAANAPDAVKSQLEIAIAYIERGQKNLAGKDAPVRQSEEKP